MHLLVLNQTCIWRRKQSQGHVALNNVSAFSFPVKPVFLHRLTLFPQQKFLVYQFKVFTHGDISLRKERLWSNKNLASLLPLDRILDVECHGELHR